ncbi:hypothetical protein, partial [Paenibacillus sp. EPM92]|uniref:hypothetical protein n=1 Tax=Paenibacillus sp. EPM92 TaxID=1561195 RepID=UPI001F421350
FYSFKPIPPCKESISMTIGLRFALTRHSSGAAGGSLRRKEPFLHLYVILPNLNNLGLLRPLYKITNPAPFIVKKNKLVRIF